MSHAIGNAAPPLGPGDDDPRSVGRASDGDAREPLGPGALAGVDPHEGFMFLAPPPAGPGDEPRTRQIVRIPIKE